MKKARRLPDSGFALGVIEQVQIVTCGATPVIPELKPSGAVRICENLKVSVNCYADIQRNPLLHLEKFHFALEGERLSSKVEHADAYLAN